jgi:hypothetical protein
MIKVQRSYQSITNKSKTTDPDTAMTSWFARMRRQDVGVNYIDTMYNESVSGLTDIEITEKHWRANPIPPNYQSEGASAGVSVEFDPASVKW